MKNTKSKINSVKEETLKLMGVYFIVIIVTFITVILVYFIGLYKYNKSNNFGLKLFEIKKIINESEYEFLTLNNITELNDYCSDGCKFKTGSEELIFYEIYKEDDSYILDIKSLYRNIGKYNLGNNIYDLKVRDFLGYDAFSITIHNNVRAFDQVIVVDYNAVDVFSSSGTNEIEFLNDSIKYYTYSCFKSDGYNAMRFINERKPFSDTPVLVLYEYINLDIC